MHSFQNRTSSLRRLIAGRAVGISLALVSILLLATACGTSQPTNSADSTGVQLLVVSADSEITSAPAGILEGATLNGTVTILAKEFVQVTGVAFYVDDADGIYAPVHVAEEAPFTIDLDTTTLSDGEHVLTARVIGLESVVSPTKAVFEVVNTDSDPKDPADPEPVDPDPEPGVPAPEPPVDPAPPTDPTPPLFVDVPPATLYVSPNGSDSNSGRSVDAPLRTVQRAANIVQPGDVVYLRGGVYPIQVGFNTSGTSSQPIVWTSYPGEWAVFDGSDQPQMESQHRIWVTNVSWNAFLNFEVRNSPREGIWINNAHDNVFQNIVTHGNHYSGIYNYMSDRNRFEYIVTYDNFDVLNPGGKPGDDADGISIHSGDSNVVYRVTAFNNSDDGIDAWMSTNTLIDSSVSFGNGRGSHGNGNGIKAGGNNVDNRNVVRNTLSYGNRSGGFTQNGGRNVTFLNNTSFDNGGNDFVGDGSTTLYNNLAGGGRLSIGSARAENNSWNLGISNAQFLSTDSGEETFLSLASGSPAIDAGRDVGLPYSGSAPDLGALEFGTTRVSLGMPGFDLSAASSAHFDQFVATAQIR